MEFTYTNHIPNTRINLSVHLSNLEGDCVFNSISPAEVLPAGRFKAVCRIPGNLLNDSYYRVQAMIVKDTSAVLLNHNETMMFEVYDVPREANWYGKWAGVVRPKLDWELEAVSSPPDTGKLRRRDAETNAEEAESARAL